MRFFLRGLLNGLVLSSVLAACGCGSASPGGATDTADQSAVSTLAKKRIERGAQHSPEAPSRRKSR
jgi:hypothetical protein